MAKKNTEEQMKLFEEGGLKDEGGSVDPVSGNDVPSGSTQAEVRDDIPAQLSEGEFVFPADVVRYIGLENLMQLRSKAKQGLAKMEAMGQMGNSEDATMSDDVEFESEIDALIENFDPNDPSTMEFSQGGVVKAANGYFAQPQQFSYGYMPPGFGTQQQVPASGLSYRAPQIPMAQPFVTSAGQRAGASVGTDTGMQDNIEQRQYIGPNGELITIMFKNGVPQQEIPAGYKLYKPEEVKPEVTQPEVTSPGSSGDDREREEERQAQMAVDKKINNTLASYNEEFKEQWEQDPFNTGKMGIGGPFAAAYESVQTHLSRTDAIEQIAKDYNIDLDEYKNTGIKGLVSKYDDERFSNLLDEARTIQEEEGFSDKEAVSVAQQRSRTVKAKGATASQDPSEEGGTGAQTAPTRGQDITQQVRDQLASQMSSDDADSMDSGTGPSGTQTGSFDASTTDDSGYSSSFSKGGAIQQTQRALKSSRKKK
jgi:hypothetical protein